MITQPDKRRYVGRMVLGLMLLVGGLLTSGCGPKNHKGAYTTQLYRTELDDGVMLALRRYQPTYLSSEKNPVILCHGLSYNLLYWDLNEQASLAHYLAQAGFDVWSLSLRGASPSSQPLNSALRKLGHFRIDEGALTGMKQRMADLKMTDWTVDDHIRYDVPAALRFVQQQTRIERVHWIGHSMGGMIMFAYLSQNAENKAIKSFVAASVPMVVFHPLNDPFRFLLDAEPALKVGSWVVGSSAPATWGVIFGDLGTPTDKLFYNSDNIDERTLRALFHQAQEEISPGQLKQLLNMVRTERFTSLDGTVDYTAALNTIRTPTCFLVGAVDNMASPAAVQYAYREIPAADKEFHLFGRVNSHQLDYGHDDIIIGKNARREVYPVILEWLEDHPRNPEEKHFLLQPEPLP